MNDTTDASKDKVSESNKTVASEIPPIEVTFDGEPMGVQPEPTGQPDEKESESGQEPLTCGDCQKSFKCSSLDGTPCKKFEMAIPPSEPEELDLDDIPEADGVDDITANAKEDKEDYVVFNGKKYKVVYREMPWEQYNQIVEQVAIETSENSEMADRIEQMRCMKWQIKTINGESFDKFLPFITWEFGEGLRRLLYGNDGKNTLDRQLLGKLVERLEPSMQKFAKQAMQQKRGRR